MKKVIAKKSQEEIEFEEEEKIRAMRDFGFHTCDFEGNPFFIPDWEGSGYTTNLKCKMLGSDFQLKFRDYWMKGH